MRAQAARTATCALEIDVMWGKDTLLLHEYLCPARPYVLGDAPLPLEPVFAVNPEWIAGSRHELVSVHGDHVVVHAQTSDVRLALGESTFVAVGPLGFHVRLVAAERPAPGLAKSSVDVQRHLWTLASFALHGLALCCMLLMPPKASSLSIDAASEDARFLRYLALPIANDEELPWHADQGAAEAGGKQAEDAARHAGEESQAGRENAPKSGNRMAIKGNAQQRVPARSASEVAGTAGILGVLAASPSTLTPSVFGSAVPLGYDPNDAIGALFGKQIGDNFGYGGLGMRGTGRPGGGGIGGSIGIGTLDTGGAARGAPGAHSLSQRPRESRVPVLRVGESDVRGSLSKEVIRRHIQRNLNEVRYCYERELITRPDLAGRVSVQFLIAPSGTVQQTSISATTLGSSSAEACIAAAIRRINFPAPDGGGYVSVNYPFVFDRAGQ